MLSVRIFTIFILILSSSCATLPNHFEQASAQKARAVVFDIDGTLTPAPLRFWQARKDAVKAARYFSDQGFSIFYITARVPLLQWQIPGWLEQNHFPPGNVYLTETSEDRSNHGHFKTRILERLKKEGWQIEWAFGDSSSDFDAYDSAAIPVARVYALRREGADRCEPGVWLQCLSGWQEFLESVEP